MRHLLVVDTTGNLVLADVVDAIRMPIGAPLLPEQRSWVTTATWSLVGQWTAWTVDSADPDGVREIRLHDEASDQPSVLVEAARAFYLSPSPCGRRLSHVSPGPLGLEMAVTDIRTRDLHVIDRGQPLYWSWSRDGNQIAVHADDRVTVTDATGASRRVVTEDAGRFLVPAWLPGGSILHCRDDHIVATGSDGVENVITEGRTGRFMVDPEAHRLAHVTDDGHLVVLDLLTRTTTDITEAPLAGFFWSPDGTKLAALELVGEGLVRWLVSGRDGTTALPPFRPSRTWTTSVLPFFEQYAQSHTHWSGDGTQLVAPAIDDEGSAGALVQAVDGSAELDGSRWVPDVDLAWWA